MELLLQQPTYAPSGFAPGELGLDEIISQKPPTKTVREFFRSQALDICAREDRKMLVSAVPPSAPGALAPALKRRAGKRV